MALENIANRPLLLPNKQSLQRLQDIADKPSADPDVAFLASVLAELSVSVESIAETLPGIVSGNSVSVDPR